MHTKFIKIIIKKWFNKIGELVTRNAGQNGNSY